MIERERIVLEELLLREELAEKKARIYARLLTDTETTNKIEALAKNHLRRRLALAGFLGRKIENEGGMSKTKGGNGNA